MDICKINTLEACHSIEQVVDLINDQTLQSPDGSPGMIAAKYAISAAKQAGYGLGEEDLTTHLEMLTEAGAVFDCTEAMIWAENLKLLLRCYN